ELVHVTITLNIGSTSGVHVTGGTTVVWNSIIAENSGLASDVSGDTFLSLGHNLIGSAGSSFAPAEGDQVGTASARIDPLLGPLQNNGGPTLTHALLPGSPAIDRGANVNAIDQRGTPRPRDGDGNGTPVSDIGAFEL